MESEQPKQTKLKTSNILLVAAVLLIIAGLYFMMPHEVDGMVVAEFNTLEEPVTQTVVKTQLSEYAATPEEFDGRTIVVDGYLHYKLVGSATEGSYVYKLTDKEGSELFLEQIPGVYKSLFEQGKISNKAYKVSGKFVRDHDRAVLYVYKIE